MSGEHLRLFKAISGREEEWKLISLGMTERRLQWTEQYLVFHGFNYIYCGTPVSFWLWSDSLFDYGIPIFKIISVLGAPPRILSRSGSSLNENKNREDLFLASRHLIG